jgi:Tol biopolymer transport system component
MNGRSIPGVIRPSRGLIGRPCLVLALLAGVVVAGACTSAGVAQLRRPEGPPAQDFAPRIGQSLAATGLAAVADESGLWLSDETGQFRLVLQAPERGYFQDPSWSPSGDRVAITAILPLSSGPDQTLPGAGFTSEIWAVDRGRTKVLVQPEAPGITLSQPIFSGDGSTLYDSRRVSTIHDGTAGSSSGIEQRVVETGERKVVVDDGLWPAVSPDGGALAWVRFGVAGHADLWIRNLATGRERRLTGSRFGDVTSPRFSPDGRTVAFGGATYPLRAEVTEPGQVGVADRILGWLVEPALAHELLAGAWLVNVDGSNLRRVGTFVLDGPVVRWTADGAHLLLYDENGLHEVDLATGQLTTIYRPGSYRGFDWLPKLSPR